MTVHAVSKVRLDKDGRVSAVWWGRVDTQRNEWAEPECEAPVAEVVRALLSGDAVYALFPATHGHLPDRRFVVVDYDNGWQSIALEGATTHEREVHDMVRLAD